MPASRADELQGIIAEYEEDRAVTLSRLDVHRQRRTRLELAREILVEHGELAAANHLLSEINEIDKHIQAGEELLEKVDRLLDVFRTSLSRLEASAQAQQSSR